MEEGCSKERDWMGSVVSLLAKDDYRGGYLLIRVVVRFKQRTLSKMIRKVPSVPKAALSILYHHPG